MNGRVCSLCLSIGILVAGVATAADGAPDQGPTTPHQHFAIAKLLLAEGDYRAALDHFEAAVAGDPEAAYLRLEYAQVLARIGRLDQARANAEKARDLRPADPEVLTLLGQIYLAMSGDDPALQAAAVEAFERSLEARPDDLRTLLSLGRIHRSSGDLAAAERVYRQLLQSRPGSPAGDALVEILLEQGRNDEAITILYKRVEAGDRSIELVLTLADLLVEAGRSGDAAEVLAGTVDSPPSDPELLRRLATTLYRSGDEDGAIAVLDLLLADSDDLRLRLFRALLLADVGHGERAQRELLALRGEMPGEPQVVIALARVMLQQGRAEEAWVLFDELDEDLRERGLEDEARESRIELVQLLAEAEAWDRLAAVSKELLDEADLAARAAVIVLHAEALIQLERSEQALEFLEGAGDESDVVSAKKAEVLFRLDRPSEAEGELAPLIDDPGTRFRAVEVYQRVGRYDESIPLLRDILAEQPDSIQVRFWLGAAYERTGRHGEAERAFQELLEREPDFHLALNYLGYMWADDGKRLQEALGLVSRAVELDPGNPAYVDSLGWVYYRLGDYSEALTNLERAASMLPDDATVQEHLGDVHRALGNLDLAREAYRRAASLDDEEGSPAAREKLHDLEAALGDDGP